MLEFIFAILVATVTVAEAQTGIVEYEICMATAVDSDTRSVDRRLFACSRIIADGAVPQHVRTTALLRRGVAYFMHTVFNPETWHVQHERALRDLNDVVRLNPREGLAYFMRGLVYWQRNEHDRAINDFTETIRLNVDVSALGIGSKISDPYQFRGMAYDRKGDRERAIADFRKALSINPSDNISRDELKRLGAFP